MAQLNRGELRPPRLQRSELAVPANVPRFIEKAAVCSADAVFLDLEDAVAPEDRVAARDSAVRALHEIDWGTKTLAVRVNGLDSQWGLRDILAVSECSRLDVVLVPKVETSSDVEFVDRVLTILELEHPRSKRLGIEILIETTKGLANVEAIAASSPRLEAIVFGVGDYSVELQSFDLVIGAPNPDYAVPARVADHPTQFHWNDQWHFALARIANACRAYGLRPIDGPFTDFGDPEGFIHSCRRSRALGFEGKWAIHPTQVDLANREFTPSEELVRWAREITEALETAAREGRGAVGVRGVLVDQAHAKLAQRILRRAHLARVI